MVGLEVLEVKENLEGPETKAVKGKATAAAAKVKETAAAKAEAKRPREPPGAKTTRPRKDRWVAPCTASGG